jgi:hypothetical protein
MPWYPRGTVEERFWPKVDVRAPDECWEWRAGRNPNGYGVFRRHKMPEWSHRVAYELAHGAIPEGLELDHRCRNRACVNPAHLEAVTHRENIMRGTAPSARNARAIHCVNGHPFTEENTYYRPDGRGKHCRACKRQRDRAYKRQKVVAS